MNPGIADYVEQPALLLYNIVNTLEAAITPPSGYSGRLFDISVNLTVSILLVIRTEIAEWAWRIARLGSLVDPKLFLPRIPLSTSPDL
jgi:hypothetical protein